MLSEYADIVTAVFTAGLFLANAVLCIATLFAARAAKAAADVAAKHAELNLRPVLRVTGVGIWQTVDNQHRLHVRAAGTIRETRGNVAVLHNISTTVEILDVEVGEIMGKSHESADLGDLVYEDVSHRVKCGARCRRLEDRMVEAYISIQYEFSAESESRYRETWIARTVGELSATAQTFRLRGDPQHRRVRVQDYRDPNWLQQLTNWVKSRAWRGGIVQCDGMSGAQDAGSTAVSGARR